MSKRQSTNQPGQPRTSLTYKTKMSRSDYGRFVKAIVVPIIILLLSFLAIQELAGFGKKLVAPLTAFMICFGVVCALWLPSHRSTIMKEMDVTIGAYLISLLAFRQVISMMSGVSSEMLMETFNQALPMTSGSAVSGWLQNLMWIDAVLVPIGFIGIQGKRLLSFKRKNNKQTFMDQVRNVHREQNGPMS